MTALPAWTQLPTDGLTVAGYEALPEEICRRIEVVDGAIVLNASPRRPHQRIVRRLANLLESVCGGDLVVDFDVDLRLRDVPLLNRRPDVVVYASAISGDEVLRPEHCVLVVEVMSPGSITADQIDKPGEYAVAGIEHFWRVEQSDDGALTVFRYRLDPTTRIYASAGISTDKLTVTDPFSIAVDLADLV
ncbi:MAG TPA: Uma2 family endonuclease [Pseudonocardiaceae bacterium]|jgi:Uma2 family endonuclease|nr:Uma2 family endonuclease [Pseudonocardiaceae bacterium]